MHACSVASVMSNSWWPYGLEPARLLCPWNSPGKNTRRSSRGSSGSRYRTHVSYVSCTGRHVLHTSTTWQAQYITMLLLLLLSRFCHVQLCGTPEMAAHQAPPSLGFSRQEHWSGLLLPSPMHESEKWKGSRSVVSGSSRPHGLQPTRLLRPRDFPGKSTAVGCHCLLRYSSKWIWRNIVLNGYEGKQATISTCRLIMGLVLPENCY